MNKYKLKLLKILDTFIRFMGLIGGAILAVIGIIYGWWNADTGPLVYVFIFIVCLLYCEVYNGSEWAM
jgi:hypothetical protein